MKMKMKKFSTTLLITLLALVLVFGKKADAVGTDTILAMPFDEGQGDITRDFSHYGNHGTLNGAIWQDGKFGKALRFGKGGITWVNTRNDTSLSLANDTNLSLADTDFTIAVWVSLSETTGQHAFLAKDEGPGINAKWIFYYRNGRINFHINQAEPEIFLESKPWHPASNSWHQVVVTKVGNNYTFYVDGQTHGTALSNLDIPIVAAPLRIGWAENDIAMAGCIDEVLIVKRALDKAAIADHFNNGVSILHSRISTTWDSIMKFY